MKDNIIFFGGLTLIASLIVGVTFILQPNEELIKFHRELDNKCDVSCAPHVGSVDPNNLRCICDLTREIKL